MEVEGLHKLAAAQRMNTDSRRAVFFILMSAGDYVCSLLALLASRGADYETFWNRHQKRWWLPVKH